MRTRIDLRLANDELLLRRSQWEAAGLSSAVLKDPPFDSGRLVLRLDGPDWPVGLVLDLDPRGQVDVGYLADNDEVWARNRVATVLQWGVLVDRLVDRVPRMRVQHGQLVARSCTTGPLDWVHGDLWVLPGSLVRIRSGWLDTLANAYVTGTSARRAGRTIGYDPGAVLAAHHTNRIIPFADIARARLRRGLTTSALIVLMSDGTEHKLLWRSSEPAHRLLTDRLLPVLGPRLTG